MFGLLTLGKSEEASFNIVYNNIKFNKYKGSSNNKLIMKQRKRLCEPTQVIRA